MVQKIKYNRCLLFERPLTAHLVNSLQDHYCDTPWPEALIPVPLHWWKLRKRGFNQAGVIASQLSKATGVPVLHSHVKRVSHGTPQQGLSASQRQKNIRGAFAIKKPIPFTHIAVVDDVMTTGATTEELCRVLKKHGVQTVDVWCLARTPTF
ncbi:ComF family protein [Sansalvadorimonas verongulae]|uniref:ComF family protein n=1 Tax=Sansalvadorimonas verongulae TaxID=2172824 RepID=UPI0018AD2996|nr:ComF family protein [Sansalvadorimonas verongulae]